MMRKHLRNDDIILYDIFDIMTKCLSMAVLYYDIISHVIINAFKDNNIIYQDLVFDPDKSYAAGLRTKKYGRIKL